MKFFLVSLLILLPTFTEIQALNIPRLELGLLDSRQNDFKKQKSSATKKAASKTKAVDTANTNTQGADKNKEDSQTSLTLDPAVIQQNGFLNGQETPTAGQVKSLTTVNNFINHCATVPQLKLTDGLQSTLETCNPTIIGVQVAFDKMPSVKIAFPENFGTIPEKQTFTIKIAVQNLETGNFVNADVKYNFGPQQTNDQGLVIGHSHVVCQKLDEGNKQTTPLDPTTFAFFKGLNDPAVNGFLTAVVTNGLPAADYRCCTLTTTANHVPIITGKAQRGSFEDCIYMTAVSNSAGNGNNGGNNQTTDKSTATIKSKAKNTQTQAAKPKNTKSKQK